MPVIQELWVTHNYSEFSYRMFQLHKLGYQTRDLVETVDLTDQKELCRHHQYHHDHLSH